jgi:hypothetical protein
MVPWRSIVFASPFCKAVIREKLGLSVGNKLAFVERVAICYGIPDRKCPFLRG